jgi:hypothetical protein
MCVCFKVSPNSFYDWKAGGKTKRINKEKILVEKIKDILEESRFKYGSPLVWKEIQSNDLF